MMNDLVMWLRAQLDEDERAVRDLMKPVDEPLPLGRRDVHEWVMEIEPKRGHVRVLREVEAKRRIIDAHPLANEPGALPYCETCRYVVDPDDPEPFAQAGYPCPTVRLLALPYADRAGFREEWRP